MKALPAKDGFGVVEVSELVDLRDRWRRLGLTVALCHGSFDPLHVGHVWHFEAAQKLADRLVVTVTPDRFVSKGAGRPVFRETERAHMISAIRFVDCVAINQWEDAVETLRLVQPTFFVKGSDYAGGSNSNFDRERQLAEKLGIAVRITSTPKVSATQLLRTLGVI